MYQNIRKNEKNIENFNFQQFYIEIINKQEK